jgi:hypothetical protein
VSAGSTKDPCDLRLLVGSALGVSVLSEERFLALHELLYSRLSGVGQVSTCMLLSQQPVERIGISRIHGYRSLGGRIVGGSVFVKSVTSPKLQDCRTECCWSSELPHRGLVG